MDRPNKTLTGSLRFCTLFLIGISLTLALIACSSAAVVEAPAAVSQLITPLEYVDKFGNSPDHLLIDVRTAEEYESGYIEGAVNIPVQELPQRLDEVPRELPIVVYCRSGNRSAAAVETLSAAGYSPIYDMGGIRDWIAAGLPTQ